jgi:hypothetical protein
MDRRIGHLLLFIALLVSGRSLADGLDAQGEVQAKEATRLFNLGQYEEAAPIYAKLAVDYPDMVVFLRNLGACNYYLNRPEPALSSLRRYLKQRTDIKPEDKSTVDRWIDEMEKLRAARLRPEEPKTTAPVPEAASLPVLPVAASAPPPAAPAAQPAGVDLQAGPAQVDEARRPFYKTWWFWTGAAAVTAGAVTTAILLSRGSSSACDGKGPNCIVAE